MADKKKLCLMLGPISATKTEQRKISGWLRHQVIEPVMSKNFPDYELRRMTEFDNQDANIADVMSADLVIADMSDLHPNVLFELGLRHSTLLPTVHMAADENQEIAYFDLTLFHVIKFNPGEDSQSTRRALKIAVDEALADNKGIQAAPQPNKRELVARLEVVTTTIANLRINSLGEHIDELEAISNELKQQASKDDTPTTVRQFALRALPILTHLFDALGSKQGAQVIIAGAAGAIMSAGGWPAVTTYALTLAVWQGKDAFMAALDKLSPGKTRATRRNPKK